ncbi:MAG TPA: hypothetical protein PLA79_01470 [Bacteroidales bacterium]|nr:hypothetical protein [Bacteroidales bacterium]
MGTEGEKQESIFDRIFKPFKELQSALKSEKALKGMADDPEKGYKGGTIILDWLKKYWFIPFGGVIFIMILSNRASSRGDKKRSHHGVNKYGERY